MTLNRDCSGMYAARWATGSQYLNLSALVSSCVKWELQSPSAQVVFIFFTLF